MQVDPAAEEAVDPDVTITLPVSAWTVVMAHLGRGVFCDVATIVNSMCEQADLQIRPVQPAISAKTPARVDPGIDARRKLQ